MKQLTIFTSLTVSLLSCDKESTEDNEIGKYVNSIIEKEEISVVYTTSSNAFTPNEFSFPGNNFIRIGKEYYNLEHLVKFEIEPRQSAEDVNSLKLHFKTS